MHGTSLALQDRALTILAACQEEVQAVSGNLYYASAYRATELGYWSPILYWMLADFGPTWPRKVLDVGCAYGTLLLASEWMTQMEGELYGIDFSPSYTSLELVGKHRINFAMCNVELDPLPWPVQFDAILLTEVLEHFNFQASPTLRKLRSALAPGGRIYLSTPDAIEWGRNTRHYPNYMSLPAPDPSYPVVDEHVWHFSESELRQVLHEAGLTVTRFAFSAAAGRPRHFNVTLEAA